jgi:hypothetical protein
MEDIALGIPVELTTAQIQRANLSLTEDAAYEVAVELHNLVVSVRKLYSVRPTCESYAESEETDLVDTMLRNAQTIPTHANRQRGDIPFSPRRKSDGE